MNLSNVHAVLEERFLCFSKSVKNVKIQRALVAFAEMN